MSLLPHTELLTASLITLKFQLTKLASLRNSKTGIRNEDHSSLLNVLLISASYITMDTAQLSVQMSKHIRHS